MQSKCRQFMGEFVGDDRVESEAVVYKESPNVRVFVFQMGEGIMEDRSGSV